MAKKVTIDLISVTSLKKRLPRSLALQSRRKDYVAHNFIINKFCGKIKLFGEVKQ